MSIDDDDDDYEPVAPRPPAEPPAAAEETDPAGPAAPVRAAPQRPRPVAGGVALPQTDTILKLTIAFAVLLAGIGVFYYFVIHLPAEDRAKREQAVAVQAAAEKRASDEAAARQRREAARKTAYDQCQARADDNYTLNWDRNCASLAAVQRDAYSRCMSNNYGYAYCIATYPALQDSNCRLSTATAQSISDLREQEKARCAEESEIAAASAGGLPK